MKAFLLSCGALIIGLFALLAVFWRKASRYLLRRSTSGVVESPTIHEAALARLEARRRRIFTIKSERQETIKCRAERARKEIEEKFGKP